MAHRLGLLFGHKHTRIPVSRPPAFVGLDGEPVPTPSAPPIPPTARQRRGARRLHRWARTHDGRMG
jgi:hypothetical protein